MWTDLNTLNLTGRRVFLRADLNVPLQGNAITDEFRIAAALPTIEHLLDQGCEVVLASHLGRPKGADPTLSLSPVAARLSTMLGREVPLVTGYDTSNPFDGDFPPGRIALLENLRFNPGEEKNDAAYAEALARLAEVYIDDAFGTAHRPAASIVGIAERLPAYPGFLMFREVEALTRLLHPIPEMRPYAVLIGGAKVSDKLPVLRNLLGAADMILIGGAMAFTFIKADGGDPGASLVEESALDAAADFLTEAEARGKLVFLPDDANCGSDLKGAVEKTLPAGSIPSTLSGFDIGPETIDKFLDILEDAATIFWNGPMGVYENAAYAVGTRAMAAGIAEIDAYKVAGGGDTLAAINACGVGDSYDHLSTGGGASLEFLSGLELPGVAVLRAHSATAAG